MKLISSFTIASLLAFSFGQYTVRPFYSGGLLLFSSGTSCPSGTTEATELDGKNLIATTIAHGNVGEVGGADNVIPVGTNNALTFTGSPANTSSVSGGTPSGSNGTSVVTPLGSNSTSTFTGNSVTSSAVSAGTPAGTNASTSFTPSGTNATSTVTPTGTINTPTLSWPAGVPTNASGAFSQGAISWPAAVPTFTGNAFSSIINHTHPNTAVLNMQGGTTAATTGTHVLNSTATGGSVRAITSGDAIVVTNANPAGGVSSITPTGANAWPAGVPTIAAGIFTQPTISWPVGVPTSNSLTFTGSSSTVGAQIFTGTSGTVPAETFTGSALGTHTHTTTATGTVSAPTFTGSSSIVGAQIFTGDALSTHLHTITPTGTINTPLFTGTQFDNRSAFVKVIVCRAQ